MITVIFQDPQDKTV